MTERAFVDTNVILYSFDPSSSYYPACRALVESTSDPAANLWMSPQIFCEVFRYVTHPRAITPRDPVEVLNELESLLVRPGLGILSVPIDITARMIALIRRSPIRGRRVFDVQIVATMLGNGISRIYTYNPGDFQYPEIQALEPSTATSP